MMNVAALGAPPRVPPLREDLELAEGPVYFDGSPTWLLHDPVTGRFVKIGWMQFEILRRWGLGTAEAIAGAVCRFTTLTVTQEDVQQFAMELGRSEFLRPSSPEQVKELLRKKQAAVPRSLLYALIKNYIFFKVPLLSPAKAYARWLPATEWLASRGFFLATLMAGLLGAVLALRQWDVFWASFPYLATPGGIVFAVLSVLLLKSLHELAHGLVATRYGCRVRTVGVAFMFFAPLLYTDTSEAWRLRDRKKRLLISAAGILSDLSIACWALLLWNFVPDGALRNVLFVWAGTSWVLTLLVNANPFMRFDGYYILSDYLDQPNLQTVSFALGRWRLRRALLGLDDPPPYHLEARRQRFLILYAYGTWIYRLFLFLGIAYAIYYLMPKVLALPLAAFEVVWFIALPVLKELGSMAAIVRRQPLRARSMLPIFAVLALLVLLAVPWRSTVEGYGLAGAERRVVLAAPEASQVIWKTDRLGNSVSGGEVLFRLQAPAKDHEAAQLRNQIAALRTELEAISLAPDHAARVEVLKLELRSREAALASAVSVIDQLAVRSPFRGQLVEIADPLAEGDWLERSEPLAMVADLESGMVEAFIDEGDLQRIKEGAQARVVPFNPDQATFGAEVTKIEANSIRELSDPILASTHGGPIPARSDANGVTVPEQPIYRVLLKPDAGLPLSRMALVQVNIQGEAQSLLSRMWRYVVGVFIRESGF